MVNKNVLIVAGVIFVAIVALFTVLGSVVVSYIFGTIDNQLSEIDLDIQLNNVSWSWNESYQQYLQPTIVAAATTMPKAYSIGVCVGMLVLMLIVGYLSGDKHRLWIILDLIILVGAFIFAVQIREGYLTVLQSYQDFYIIGTTIMSEASRFIMHLPVIVTILGVLVMLMTYGLKSFRDAAKAEDNPASPFEEVDEEEY